MRSVLFQNNTKPLELPTPTGKTVTLSKKVFVPAKDYPDVSSKTTLLRSEFNKNSSTTLWVEYSARED